MFKKINNRSWNSVGIFLKIEFGIFSSLGVFPFARFLRHMPYVILSKIFDSNVVRPLLFSKSNPLRLCHEYCFFIVEVNLSKDKTMIWLSELEL